MQFVYICVLISQWQQNDNAAPLGGCAGATALEVDDTVAFPEAAKSGQLIKLPGQNRVTADEYQEFTTLGQGGIFDLDLDRHGIEKTHPPPLPLAGTATCTCVLHHRSVFMNHYCTQIGCCRDTGILLSDNVEEDLTGDASWWRGTPVLFDGPSPSQFSI